MVTGTVVSWPWITIPSESPTSTTSTPAASSSTAKLASYTVMQAIFSPRCFICAERAERDRRPIGIAQLQLGVHGVQNEAVTGCTQPPAS